MITQVWPAPEEPASQQSAAVTAMLEARTGAVVGASPRPGTLGQRMVSELHRSPAAPRSYLINPRYDQIAGMRCRDRELLEFALADAGVLKKKVIVLTAGSSAGGHAMVAAHSGALATAGGGWAALCAAYGVHRAGDLSELAGPLELFAAELGVPFAQLSEPATARLGGLIAGLDVNPLICGPDGAVAVDAPLIPRRLPR